MVGCFGGPRSTLVVHMDPLGSREADTKTDVESHVHVSERVPDAEPHVVGTSERVVALGVLGC